MRSGTLAKPYPGRSAKTILSGRRKKLICCVRPGVELVRASPWLFVSRLISVDLPTFERPAKANSGRPNTGALPVGDEIAPAKCQPAATAPPFFRPAAPSFFRSGIETPPRCRSADSGRERQLAPRVGERLIVPPRVGE